MSARVSHRCSGLFTRCDSDCDLFIPNMGCMGLFVIVAITPCKHLHCFCKAGNSDKKYGGTREDVSVTVHGNKSEFNHSGSQNNG